MGESVQHRPIWTNIRDRCASSMSCYTAQLRNATFSNSLAYCMLNTTSTLVVRKKILRSVGLSWQYSCFSLADLTLPCAAGHGDSVALCAARFDSVEIMEVLIANSVTIDTKALGFAVVDSNKINMLRLLVGTTDNDFADQSRLQADRVHFACRRFYLGF